jgi:hypothetical protein
MGPGGVMVGSMKRLPRCFGHQELNLRPSALHLRSFAERGVAPLFSKSK